MLETSIIDWAPGDILGLDFPAHPEALQAGGPDFLTRAFRANGALGADNSVTRITGVEEFALGGTGVKLLLSVAYAREARACRATCSSSSRAISRIGCATAGAITCPPKCG
jgi:hypothetical protein